MIARYCTCALLLLVAPVAARGQDAAGAAAPPGEATASTYTIFASGMPVGREEVTVRTDAEGILITSQSRLAPPLNSVVERAEFLYAPDWTPRSFVLEATSAAGPVSSRTSFENGTATTEGASAGAPLAVSHEVAPRAVMLPNGVFGAYQALASRLVGAAVGTELQVYVVPAGSFGVRVAAVHDERVQTGTTLIEVRRYELAFANPGGELAVHLTAGTDASLVRVSIPDQGIDVVRSDFTAANARTNIHSNPGDEAVFIPAEGFSLGATVTRPAASAGRMPAVVLLAGSNAPDRDGFGAGRATIGQLAGALADAGFLVVRYDRRGHAQSGGRAESATVADHAEDLRTVVRWLRERPDVDGDRVAVVGHGEGGWVSLLAASRERRIAAAVTISTPSVTGEELMLEWQRQALDRLNLPPEERQKRIDDQARIHEAVRTGRGWDDIAADVRRSADTAWFESLLAFDPARVAGDVRQPLLVVHPALDREVAVEHADRLVTLARRSRAVEVVIVRGVNHMLVPATDTGGVPGPIAPEATISPDVTEAISRWLVETLAAG